MPIVIGDSYLQCPLRVLRVYLEYSDLSDGLLSMGFKKNLMSFHSSGIYFEGVVAKFDTKNGQLLAPGSSLGLDVFSGNSGSSSSTVRYSFSPYK